MTTRLSEAWTIAQFHPRNIAEHALVEAVVGGIAQLAGTDRATLVAIAVPQIIANEHARHGHAFAVRDFRDNVRPDLGGKVITIAREDDALLRLGLGWRVRERTAGGQVEGWDDCRAFLTDLVRWLEDDLLARLSQFDRRAMLAMLLRNHEVSAFDRDVWKRTSAAMLALHGETAETLATITDHEFKLNAVFHATRIVVEMAICACPLDGGATKPGRIDLARLMAQASLLAQVGGWSDAMRWGLMKPELRITPLGDVHADFGFVDAILMPHGRVVSEGRIEQAVTKYGDNLMDRPVEVSVAGRLEPAFEQAWVEQFGATIDQTRTLIDWVEQLGIDAGKAVIAIRRSRFTAIEAASQRLDDKIAAQLVDGLTLTHRPDWRDVPAGFLDRDRQPWRFRRQLSFVRRPLLQVDDSDDPTLLFAPGMLRDTFVYLLGNLHQGSLPEHQLAPGMKAWAKRQDSERGLKFEREVTAALASAGWHTEQGVKITKSLNRSFDRDYGDVDVLAWRESDRRVLIIECKDVQFRKSIGEIAEQLADFRGELTPKGKPDYLLKHLNRVDLIRANLLAVTRYTGLPALAEVESHLLFRHPVPMEFALARLAEKVTVSRFDRLAYI